MDRLKERNTFEVCSNVHQVNDKPKPVKSKFAFRITRKPDRSIKYRYRLVASDYSQIYGINCNKTFAPTAKWKSVCTLLFLAAVYDWNVEGLEVENAYLEAYLDAEIYMNLPPEICKLNGKPVEVKLIRSLYRLKQTGELWNSLLNSKLLAAGFTRLIHGQCVYVKHDIETNAKTFVVITDYSTDEIYNYSSLIPVLRNRRKIPLFQRNLLLMFMRKGTVLTNPFMRKSGDSDT
jgi:hypothetical protein